MPIQLNEENSGKVLVLHIRDKLVEADYHQFVPELERLVGLHGKLRLLFRMTDFLGWDAGTQWVDTEFAVHQFTNVSRLAIVGEKNCQNGMAIFCKPFTRATIRYFKQAEASDVRQWLAKA